MFFFNETKKQEQGGTSRKSSEPGEAKNIPVLRNGFLSVFGLTTVVDELASSDVCRDKCINHILQCGTPMCMNAVGLGLQTSFL